MNQEKDQTFRIIDSINMNIYFKNTYENNKSMLYLNTYPILYHHNYLPPFHISLTKQTTARPCHSPRSLHHTNRLTNNKNTWFFVLTFSTSYLPSFRSSSKNASQLSAYVLLIYNQYIEPCFSVAIHLNTLPVCTVDQAADHVDLPLLHATLILQSYMKLWV